MGNLANMRVLATLMIMVVSLCGLANATTHTVGDSSGWALLAGANAYQGWAASHSFVVGDILYFKYKQQSHNVNQVKEQDYNTCNIGSAIATFSSGSDSVTLGTPGDYYFVCGIPGHCEAGMKMHISVSPSSSNSPVPVPSSPLLPVPAPPSSSNSPVPVPSSPLLPVPVPPSSPFSSSCQPPPVGATIPYYPPGATNFPTVPYTSAASHHYSTKLSTCLLMATALGLFLFYKH